MGESVLGNNNETKWVLGIRVGNQNGDDRKLECCACQLLESEEIADTEEIKLVMNENWLTLVKGGVEFAEAVKLLKPVHF